MPVAVIGVGRSGTSMTTRLLNIGGMYIGSPKGLLAANELNEKGYFESREIWNLNARILTHFGGSWDFPPRFVPGWQLDPALDAYYEQASEIIASDFAGNAVWGWKDPGTTLLLPFWKRLIPDLKFVVCLRNPLDMARSYHRMREHSFMHYYALWHIYYLSIFSYLDKSDFIVTHYERYFADYQAELNPLLEFIGLPSITLESAAHRTASEFMDRRLQHYHSTLDDILTDETMPYPAKQLYIDLCTNWLGDVAQHQTANIDALQSLLYPILGSDDRQKQLQSVYQRYDDANYRAEVAETILSSKIHLIASRIRSLCSVPAILRSPAGRKNDVHAPVQSCDAKQMR